MNLRIKSETPARITLDWDPITGDAAHNLAGFKFRAPDGRTSHTWDPARTTVTFSKQPGTYEVAALFSETVGLDGYDWGMTFTQVFKTAVDRVRVLLPGKPVWIAETNVSNKLPLASQQAWLEDAFRKAAEWKLDGVCLFIRQHDDGSWIWADTAAQAAVKSTVAVMPEYA